MSAFIVMGCIFAASAVSAFISDKICVSGSFLSTLDGTYRYHSFDDTHNGAIYFQSKNSKYLFPIVYDNKYEWCINSDISEFYTDAYATVTGATTGYLFDIRDAFNNWKYINRDTNSYNSDTDLTVIDCTDICVSNSDQTQINGRYTFQGFDATLQASIYYYNNADIFYFYLHGVIRDNDEYIWWISHDETTDDGYSYCTIGSNLGTDYVFDLNSCEGKWMTDDINVWISDTNMMVEPCESIPDPYCKRGVQRDDVCCMLQCGICGGTACNTRSGGSSACCMSTINAAALSCSMHDAPCVLDPTLAPTAAPSSNPTLSPTMATNEPSSAPSSAPTSNPTISPTLAPTEMPNVSPLANIYAIKNPTVNPSIEPSGSTKLTTDTVSVKDVDQIIYVRFVVIGSCLICAVILVIVIICHRKIPETSLCEQRPINLESVNKPQALAVQELESDHDINTGNIEDVARDNDKPDEYILDEEGNKDAHNMTENMQHNQRIIKRWLTEVVKLPQYYDNFMANEYDDITLISGIKEKSKLANIGITVLGHQTRIIVKIEELAHAVQQTEIIDNESVDVLAEHLETDIGNDETCGFAMDSDSEQDGDLVAMNENVETIA